MAIKLCGTEHLHVGRDTLYNEPISIVSSAEAEVHIGSFGAIGKNLKVLTLNHDYNYPAVQGSLYRHYFESPHPGAIGEGTRERTKGDVHIGSDVWIGDDVKIMSGVTIGHGCCIGAGSIVTRDLAPYSIAAGIPCKAIKQRYKDDMVHFLLELCWWDWSDEKIKSNKDFFMSNLSSMSVSEIQTLIK
tara:strand:+ start:7903 stop:8466 length:564 start_codon:yes stop_codon:yes gene_type:complete